MTIAQSGAAPRVSPLTVASFGAAGAAVGLISGGLNFLLLLYYHHVLHLSAALAGLALALALVLDGFADPLIGYVSDRWRSSLGRRHPFLLLASVLMALGYLIIWFPPFDRQQQFGLFLFLLFGSALLRVSLSLFDIPANALIAEVTRDYETRTHLSVSKISLQIVSTSAVGIAMYAIWLRDTPGIPGSGLLSPEGYQSAAWWISGLILIAGVLLPLGLWSYIPRLREVAGPQQSHASTTPLQLLKRLFETYTNRSILALLLASIFLAVALGLSHALWVYLYSMFWALSSAQINAIQVSYLLSAIVSLLLLPRIGRGRDKRRLSLVTSGVFWVVAIVPIGLRLADVAPDNGDPALLALLCAHALVEGSLLTVLMSLLMSMFTDAVEDNLLRTGRREEGVVLAGQTFVTKVSNAAGTLLGAGILTAIDFPQGEAIVPASVLRNLGAFYACVTIVIGVISVSMLVRYGISRRDHEEHLAALARASR